MTPQASTKKRKTQAAAKRRRQVAEQARLMVIAALIAASALGFWAGSQTEQRAHQDDHDKSAKQSHQPHATYEVPDGMPAPTVAVRLVEDSKSGYNVFLDVTNFRFAPEHAGQAHADGEGHAHLYLDGKKIARLYGPAYYLETSSLAKGAHTLSVTLNTNDHKDIVKNGQALHAEKAFDK